MAYASGPEPFFSRFESLIRFSPKKKPHLTVELFLWQKIAISTRIG
jgi:hypothetical protein